MNKTLFTFIEPKNGTTRLIIGRHGIQYASITRPGPIQPVRGWRSEWLLRGKRTSSVAKAERPLSVQLGDVRIDTRQRAKRADSGHSSNRDRTFGLAVIRRGELIGLIENNVVVHTDHGMIRSGTRSLRGPQNEPGA